MSSQVRDKAYTGKAPQNGERRAAVADPLPRRTIAEQASHVRWGRGPRCVPVTIQEAARAVWAVRCADVKAMLLPRLKLKAKARANVEHDAGM